MPYDVFISYASSDRGLAEEVNRRLLAEGFKVWFDKDRLDPGYDWHRLIEQGCENSRVLLPILTPRWKQSDWTKFETYGAEAVIPLVYEGTWGDVSTPPLERYQAERLDFAVEATASWPRLLAALRRTLAEPPPEKVTRVHNLRYRANDYFTGREKELINIHEQLHCNPRAVLTQGRVRVIAAMGGAGKTTLARHYAEKFWRCYPQMFWIDCRLGFEPEFAHIHDLLFPDRINVGLKEADKAASALLELNGPAARLLILDNAEDESATMKWIPKTGSCHTLITSRFAGWSAATKAIHLYLLESAPSVEFLQKRVHRNLVGTELAACETLSEKLGYLPLALEQAAAYIEQQGEGFGFTEYLQLYDEATSELLTAGALGSTEYPDSVITTWKSTIAKLTPGSRTILHLCSYLASSSVSVEMIIEGADIVREYTSRFTADVALPAGSSNAFWVRAELAHLKAYSMAQLDGQAFTLHPLVQVVELLADTREKRFQGWNYAVALLQKAAPPASWEGDRRVLWSLANEKRWAEILLHIARLRQLTIECDGCVASKTFRFLSVNALASQSQGRDRQALDECQMLMDSIGNDGDCGEVPYLDVLKALAYLEKENGRHEEALRDFTTLYQARVNLLGVEAVDTLHTRHVMGCVLQLLGRTNEAETLMKEVLSIQKRVMGEDHYDAIISLHNLGWLLFSSEDRWLEAEPLYRHAFERWKRTVGFSILDTRIAAQNLVVLLERKQDFAQAEQIQMELITGSEAALGPDHKDTVEAINRVGIMLSHRGDPEKAEPFLRRVFESRVKIAGAEHQDTTLALQNLATVLEMTGNLAAALPLSQRVLDACERNCGTDHPDTLQSVAKVASLLARTGRAKEAIPLHHRLLEVKQKELGREHTDVIHALNNHAYALRKEGLVLEAEPFDRHVAETSAKLLGEAHPSSLHRRNNLVLTLILLGKLDEARELLSQNAQAKAPPHENLTPRIPLLRWVVEVLADRTSEATIFLGRLKTHFSREPMPIFDGIQIPWDLAYFIDALQPNLGIQNTELLRALVAVLNARSMVPPSPDLPAMIAALDAFPVWRVATPQQLE